MNLSWFNFLPVVGGLIGALIGSHFYKQNKYRQNKRSKK